MCVIVYCNQSPYFEDEEGRCYYHWKVKQGLITPEKSESMSKMTHRNSLYQKYERVAHLIANRTEGITEDEREDLDQHLLLNLWILTDKVRQDAHEKEVYNFVRLSLCREANYYINYILTNNTNVVPIHDVEIEDIRINPAELFDMCDMAEHRKYLVWQFVFQELTDFEGKLFNDLFLDTEIVTLRVLGTKYDKSHEFIRKYGLRLYERFKIYITKSGCKITDYI